MNVWNIAGQYSLFSLWVMNTSLTILHYSSFQMRDLLLCCRYASQEKSHNGIGRHVLESQCIPTDPALWSIDSADEFWQVRGELLADSFNEYIRKSLPSRRL